MLQDILTLVGMALVLAVLVGMLFGGTKKQKWFAAITFAIFVIVLANVSPALACRYCYIDSNGSMQCIYFPC